MTEPFPETPPPSSPPPLASAAPPPPVVTASSGDRTMAMLAHLITIISSFIGPLIIWLVKKDESSFVDHHGKESLNFQITILIISIGLFIVSLVTCGIGAVLYLPLWILQLVLVIMASIRANDGVLYRYPVCLRLIR